MKIKIYISYFMFKMININGIYSLSNKSYLYLTNHNVFNHIQLIKNVNIINNSCI